MPTQPKFAGVYPPIATPFTDSGELALDGLRSNIARWIKSGLDGLLVLGSNGEWPYLDEDERELMVETVVGEVSQAKSKGEAKAEFRVIAGTGRESTRATIRATKKAADLGADAAIVVNPAYYTGQMTDEVLFEHYKAVAAESPVPVLVYNVPPYTGVNLSAGLVTRLAQVENIWGVKDTSANIVQIGEIAARTPASFATLAGSASFLLPSLAVGACGGVLALANVAPEECVALVRSYHAGDFVKALEIHQRMLPVNAAITTRFGAAGLKAAMAMRGFYGGPPRRPLLPLKPDAEAELKKILTAANLTG